MKTIFRKKESNGVVEIEWLQVEDKEEYKGLSLKELRQAQKEIKGESK